MLQVDELCDRREENSVNDMVLRFHQHSCESELTVQFGTVQFETSTRAVSRAYCTSTSIAPFSGGDTSTQVPGTVRVPVMPHYGTVLLPVPP